MRELGWVLILGEDAQISGSPGERSPLFCAEP
jgi:hypothetical protein